MARQAGPLYLTGTIDDITFYKMEGEYLARKKSSLTRKQFRTDPRFARSRKSAEKFGQASQLASQIYWQLPKAQRGKGVVNQLTGQVGRLLKAGKSVEEIQELLCPAIGGLAKPENEALPPIINEPEIKESNLDSTLSKWNISPKGKLKTPRHQASHLMQQQSIQLPLSKRPAYLKQLIKKMKTTTEIACRLE